MGSIGEIYADAGLHVDNSGFSQYTSALNEAGTKSSVFGVNASMAMSGIAVGFGAMAVGAVASGVAMASSYQQSAMTLETLYGSQQRAREEFVWLADYAAATPFDFPGLMEADIVLKNTGLEAQKFMKTMVDTASVYRDQGVTVAQVSSDMASALSGNYESMEKYGMHFIAVNKQNFAQLGLDENAAGQEAVMYTDKNMQSKIKVLDKYNKEASALTMQAILDNKYAGAAEKQATSIAGLMSTILDNVGRGLAEIVGYSIADMGVRAGSLLAVVQTLVGGLATLSTSFVGLNPNVINAGIAIAAVTGLTLIMAAAMIATGTGSMTAVAGIVATTVASWGLGAAISAAIWPATLIVGTLALLAAGAYVLEQKTGLLTTAWTVLKDTFTITVNFLKDAFGGLSIYIAEEVTKINEWLIGLIPQELIDTVNSFGNFIKTNLGGAFTDWHTKAEAVRAKNVEVGASVGDIVPKVATLDEVLQSVTGDATTTTATLSGMNNVSTSAVTGQVQTTDNAMKSATASGAQLGATMTADGQISMGPTTAQVQGADSAIKSADVSGRQLGATITADGQISMGGTTGQLQQIDSTGKATNVTMGQLGAGLKANGSVSFAGTQGQLVLTDSAGKRVVVTEQQALQTAQSYNAQSLAAVRGQIDATISRWQAASKAANDAMVVGHAANVAAKTLAGSYGSSGGLGNTSAGGVKVLAAGQAVQSTSHVTTVNNTYNQPTASDKKGQLAIIGRS